MTNDITTIKETKPERKKYVLKKRGVGVNIGANSYKVNYEQELNEAQLEAVNVISAINSSFHKTLSLYEYNMKS